jgi:tRNA modification GTPase
MKIVNNSKNIYVCARFTYKQMSIHNLEDTIIALATPPGVGAISVIRLSGPHSIQAADSVFSGKIRLVDAHTHTIHYGNIIGDNEIVDDVLVSVFKAPNSYTGEDCIEISSHGSPLISQRIISEILNSSDVRLAEPGEFTKRAFLNGKMDLTQAEAVADLINSRTSISSRGFRNQMDGLLSSKVTFLRTSLIDISSFVELELDFAEEDIEFVKRTQLIGKINEILREIEILLESYSFGKIIRDGINVAIVGEPNVGKSSLLNCLLKESRAIVSEIPGTTRDTIREEVSIDGFLFRLYDTAGLRASDDIIEKEGIERSREAVRKSDLVLFVGDVNVGFSSILEKDLTDLNSTVEIVKVLNKIDLGIQGSYSEDFRISAVNGLGIIELINGLKNIVLQNSSYSEKSAVVTNVRHYDCLKKAKNNLLNSKNTATSNLSGEFLASDLRAAETALAEIIGEVTTEEVLNNIFSKFCIGK